jgi:hypothetical protein
LSGCHISKKIWFWPSLFQIELVANISELTTTNKPPVKAPPKEEKKEEPPKPEKKTPPPQPEPPTPDPRRIERTSEAG